jgi:hypothetical protein
LDLTCRERGDQTGSFRGSPNGLSMLGSAPGLRPGWWLGFGPALVERRTRPLERARDRSPARSGRPDRGAVEHVLEERVRVWLEPDRLAQPGRLGQLDPGKRQLHLRPSPSGPEHVQRAAGRNRVQPVRNDARCSNPPRPRHAERSVS